MSQHSSKSLLGKSPNSYGTTANAKRNNKKDEEDPLGSSARTRSWHTKHDSFLATGHTEQNNNTTESAFAPLIRTMSSGRAAAVIGSAEKHGEQAAAASDASRKLPVPQQQQEESKKGGFPYYIIYAIVNVIISLPGLYGYAAVIFNHPVFVEEMNALSKFVIFSSLIHQLGFLLFSSLNFAIGTVQDAGLIFLSSMSNTIANSILKNGGTTEEIVSTTCVLLAISTLLLGCVLVIMGKCQIADAVSYLPMPVVGGYLAFIGFFCLQAGVGLCISESIMSPKDWAYLLEPHLLILAIPGLLSGLCMTLVSRNVQSDAALPLLMVMIPLAFYIVIWITGVGMEGAREANWVGQVSPPVPVSELFGMINFKQVQWHLLQDILPTWVGMVFVVSFASCLDVAAISLDMGEALDTNRELATVGICNIMSGFTLGYTGSYIFSQTIFTYRTGVHSRWIGFFIMCVFFYVVVSPMNVLQMAPLFFFGATLIFIGYDLLYEWLVEIRHKIFLTEYAIVWATFIAIQVVGIDFGIILGVLVAIINHVVATAQITGVYRVSKQSRAVWTPHDYKLLHDEGYHPFQPKIVTLEIVGTVFFGSSLQLLERISEEIGLNIQEEELSEEALLKSPHRSSYQMSLDSMDRRQSFRERKPTVKRATPKFVVLDLTLVPNLDASASRGCFLQLAKTCAKKNIIVCAAGANPKVEWMLRSHDCAYEVKEEAHVEAQLQARADTPSSARARSNVKCDRLLLFLTIHEALEFCENVLIHELNSDRSSLANKRTPSFLRLQETQEDENSIVTIICHILGLDEDERRIVEALGDSRYHDEVHLKAGDLVFDVDTHPNFFCIVLKGSVAVAMKSTTHKTKIVSGAGPVHQDRRASALMDPSMDMHLEGSLSSIWPVGGIFGYVDFLLERPRRFHAVAAQDDTIMAKFTRSQLALLRQENEPLDNIMQRLLLRASILDLAGCTCRD